MPSRYRQETDTLQWERTRIRYYTLRIVAKLRLRPKSPFKLSCCLISISACALNLWPHASTPTKQFFKKSMVKSLSPVL